MYSDLSPGQVRGPGPPRAAGDDQVYADQSPGQVRQTAGSTRPSDSQTHISVKVTTPEKDVHVVTSHSNKTGQKSTITIFIFLLPTKLVL